MCSGLQSGKNNGLTLVFLETKFNSNINVLEYQSLIDAILAKWKQEITADPNARNYYMFHDGNIKINNNIVKLEELITIQIYWLLLERITERPTSESKWLEKTFVIFLKETGPIVTYSLTKDTRILSFHFKVTPRTLACNYNLKTWKIIDSNSCTLCSGERKIP